MKRMLSLSLLFALLVAGCVSPQGRHTNSSLVDFLYPKGQSTPMEAAKRPRLQLPLRAAIAFVPSDHRKDGFAPTAAMREELLREVRDAFQDRPYIKSIAIIPDTYLRPGAGFASVEQLSRLLGFDVIALVSYDQALAEEERKSSLLYWTIAGMYLVKGDHHSMHSFVDTAVFDVETRALLLRAPGIDVRSANTTLIEKTATSRDLAASGMRAAMQDMMRNLDSELISFEQRIREDRSVEVIGRNGKSALGGGGGLSLFLLIPLLAVCGYGRRAAWVCSTEPLTAARASCFHRHIFRRFCA